jgi:hypothetical protein
LRQPINKKLALRQKDKLFFCSAEKPLKLEAEGIYFGGVVFDVVTDYTT